MECSKAEQLMQSYVDGSIKLSRLGSFIEHVESCESCYDDLEIHVLVEEGLARLENGSAFDLNQEMQERLEAAREFILKRERLLSVIYAVELTAGITVGIVLAVFLSGLGVFL